MSELTAWLLSDRPQSRRQAALGRAYSGWRTFAHNRLAMVGLAIVLALVAVAVLADGIAPYPPTVSQPGSHFCRRLFLFWPVARGLNRRAAT